MWLLPLLALPLFFYSLVILFFKKAWRNSSVVGAGNGVLPTISVVIACRDEATNLVRLSGELERQTYPANKFEVILVDDHSTDGGFENLRVNFSIPSNFSILRSPLPGKKAALSHGIKTARGRLIATTDGDCYLPEGWLSRIAEQYLATGAAMLVGPVTMKTTGSWGTTIQQLDYYALQLSGASAIIVGKPLYCSGANLAFERQAYLAVANKLDGTSLASGDDVFALHAFKRDGQLIHFMRDSGVIVTTPAAPGWGTFLLQRARWGGKSIAYRDLDTILVALMVLAVNLATSAALLVGLAWPPALWAWFITWVAKSAVEYSYLEEGKKFFNVAYRPRHFFFYSLVHPLVITASAALGVTLRQKWRGRPV